MSPKTLLEKNKERENRKSEEKKKKAMAALLVFMLTSSILAVKNPALIYIFLTLAANRNLIKKDIF